MKVIQMPIEGAAEDWWIVVHDLTVADGRLRKLRPIHVFTHLAQRLTSKPGEMFALCLALENKLFGVRYHSTELHRAAAPVARPVYVGHRVRDYDGSQAVICAFEAYLGAVYSALEVTADINRRLHRDLPAGFRRQSNKFPLFALGNKVWLRMFYDLRSEFTHYSSPLPIVHEKKMVIEFRNARDLEFFEAGKKYEMPYDHIHNFTYELFDLLDLWATEELKRIDPEGEIDVIHETGWKKKLETKKVKVAEILGLLK